MAEGKARGQKRPPARERSRDAPPEEPKPAPRKPRPSDRNPAMPLLVAGREVLGRELSVFKNCSKQPVWVKGAVQDFDEPTARHKVRYAPPLPEGQAREEWLCLGRAMFMWADEDWACPAPNPTFSQRHTPQRADAVGQRVKVFWPAMGKWYQGKVVAWDAASGKHRVSYRDGDDKRCRLRQEAIVWLDVPALASEAAIAATRAAEQPPAPPPAAAASSEGDENRAPAEEGSRMRGSSQPPEKAGKGGAAANGRQPANGRQANGRRRTRRDGPAEGTSPDPRRTTRQAVADGSARAGRGGAAAKPAPAAAAAKAAAAEADAATEASGTREQALLPAGGGGDDPKSATSSSQDPAAAAPGADAAAELPQKAAAAACGKPAGAQLQGPATPAGQQQPAAPAPATAPAPAAAAPPDSRKRSRLGLPAPEPEPKRRAAAAAPAKPAAQPRPAARPAAAAAANASAAHRPRRAAEESRLGLRRQKLPTDVAFEQACQAVLGARVGVWWEDDCCYYKGQIVAHDWYHKRLKVLYDDGVEEFISPQKPDCQFTWLLPRAVTAGATDAVHAAFRLLGAANADEPAAAAAAVQSAAAAAGGGSAAEGSHLDALVPSSSAAGSGSAEARPASSAGPHPVDSTTRASGPQSRAAAQRAAAAAAAGPTGSILPGLQAALPGEHKFAVTPVPGAKPAPAPAPGPRGAAAEGWKVSLVFRGNNQIHQGRVILHDAASGKLHVLWDDGEDEWLDGAAEQLTWHADRRQGGGCTAGLPAGQQPPRGEDLVGWRIAVYWPVERQFFPGSVDAYDAELEQHTVSYNDGDEVTESLDGQVFKFVLPPHVQPVATAAAAGRDRVRRRADSDSGDFGERRPRRRARVARSVSSEPEEDESDLDSDADWPAPDCQLEPRRRAARGAAAVVPTAAQREGATAPGVATPRTCDIRRLSSRLGSVLVYEGEATNADVTPGSSPKFSPRASLGLAPDAPPDPRGPPLIDRRISGLRCAQGFRVPVKRVRVYLPGCPPLQLPPPPPPAPAAAAAAEPPRPRKVPSQQSLRQMLARVDAARQAVQTGVPAAGATDSGEAGSRPQAASAEAAAKPEERACPESPAQAAQAQGEEHQTPPPSPFAGYPTPAAAEAEAPAEVKCCAGGGGGAAAQGTALNGSMSLPQTPSAASEGCVLPPSRNNSVVSAPTLAELVHLSASLPAAGLPKPGSSQKVAG